MKQRNLIYGAVGGNKYSAPEVAVRSVSCDSHRPICTSDRTYSNGAIVGDITWGDEDNTVNLF